MWYLSMYRQEYAVFALNGSVDSEDILRDGQQTLVTAVIVEGRHPLPDLLAIKRQ
jgi:hypothetical protein